ncbi:uncharacterized protein [Elaeis guineensis]|uniref:Uncharacterized protein LOC105035472 isoform X2 n=1 Tax=Elaeis guineensis var. tenera TaxID=51953 RepID=A0A6I9QH22_ELAGV|nr:uncharacterized protein LOC105035472 isoform X2 [Elaeis guineensis]
MENSGKVFVGWEEVVMSKDKGRRLVHYYLRDAAGGKDLAVVGREKSARHMSYAVPGRFLRSLLVLRPRNPLLASSSFSSPSSSFGCSPLSSSGISLKWRSRREVLDWLSSLVSDSVTYGYSMVDRVSDDEVAEPTDAPTSKDLSSGKRGHHSKEFTWLGSAWHCKKRRKHYRSFCRNGVIVSVHDFVYVMTEENKRLVAYVEDLYEDLRANNMVVVRWFHEVDEVGILLPPDVNDREIFFSLCLQDFSVECIDGLAAVLSAQHFKKFQNEATYSKWEPYLCRWLIDGDDDVKPFDITLVQGYWNQELLRSMFTSSLKLRLKITCGGSKLDGDGNGHIPRSRLKKKQRLSSGAIDFAGTVARDMNKKKILGASNKVERHISSTTSAPGSLKKELCKQQIQQQMSPGCHVEVLSQDSGIRGCWFCCEILKRHHDKVKVRYRDVQDADGNGNLEEWILLSRVAAPDKLGIRLCGRPMVRPNRSERGRLSCSFDIGAVVDSWWHDGWWEGIVIRKESEGQIHVYFPGEQRVSIFSRCDLRPSQDWINNKWNHIEDRKDIVSSLLSDVEHENDAEGIPIRSPDTTSLYETEARTESTEPEGIVESKNTPDGDSWILKADVPDLVKGCHVDGLKWCSSKKRKRRRLASYGPDHSKRQRGVGSSSSQEEAKQSNKTCGLFMLPKSLTVDHDNCKIGGDPLFSASMTHSSLVMSR